MCSFYRPFDVFYPEGNTLTPSSQNKYIAKLLSHGMIIWHDFLPGQEYNEVTRALKTIEMQTLILKRDDIGFREHSANINLQSIIRVANDKIGENICQYFYGAHGFLQPTYKVFVHGISSDTGLCPDDLYTGTALWHVDTFVPKIATIYFPYGCNFSPFERLVCPTYLIEQNADSLRHHYRVLPPKTSMNYNYIFQSFLPPNTAITSMHHVHHRWGPFDKPGSRITMTFEHGASFGATALLSQLDLLNRSMNPYIHANEIEIAAYYLELMSDKAIPPACKELCRKDISITRRYLPELARIPMAD